MQQHASTDEPGLYDALRRHLRAYFEAHEDALPPAGLYQRMLAMLEVPLLEEALRATGGNQLQAARLLGLNRNTLHKKMKQYGLHTPRPMRMMGARRRSRRERP